jgi:hypothetical protein
MRRTERRPGAVFLQGRDAETDIGPRIDGDPTQFGATLRVTANGMILEIGNGGGTYCVRLGGAAGGRVVQDRALGLRGIDATAEPGCPAPRNDDPLRSMSWHSRHECLPEPGFPGSKRYSPAGLLAATSRWRRLATSLPERRRLVIAAETTRPRRGRNRVTKGCLEKVAFWASNGSLDDSRAECSLGSKPD